MNWPLINRLSRRALLAGMAGAVSGNLLLASGFGAAYAAEKVKIGVLAPLTGPASADGEEFVRGTTLAVE